MAVENDDREEQKNNNEPISKGERKKIRREENQLQRNIATQARDRQRRYKFFFIWALSITVIAGIVWAVLASPKSSEDDIISRRGIHWHPTLAITIDGKPQEIPSNIGIGGVHKDIHTHQINDKLHVEMRRAVRQDDIRIKKFFDIWGETFTRECILEYCNGEAGTVKMLVNGKENLEFENYLMQDNDRIEIIFEKEKIDS